MTFQGLVYTSSNEDTRYECSLLDSSHKRVLAVCGSGARALPLAAIGTSPGKTVSELVVVDSNPIQLDFARMRLAAIRDFDRVTYARFMGYEKGCLPEERRALLKSLSFERESKLRIATWFEASKLSAPCYLGHWENSIARLSRLIRAAVGSEFMKVFHCKSENEQREFLAPHFASRRWNVAVATLSQSVLLGGVFFRGRLPPLTLSDSGMRYYDSALKAAFLNGVARANFFLNLLFRGEFFPAGLPCDASPGSFERMRDALQNCQVTFVPGDLSDALRRAGAQGNPFDFVSASDVPSYWDEKALLEFHAALAKGLKPEGMAVLRHYRHRPNDSDSLKRNHLLEHRIPPAQNSMECTGLYDISHICHEQKADALHNAGRDALHISRLKTLAPGDLAINRGGILHDAL